MIEHVGKDGHSGKGSGREETTYLVVYPVCAMSSEAHMVWLALKGSEKELG